MCTDPCLTAAICNSGAAAGASAAVLAAGRDGPVGGHTDDDGSGSADVRRDRCPPGVTTSPLGSDGGGTCGGRPWTVPPLPFRVLSGVPDTCGPPPHPAMANVWA